MRRLVERLLVPGAFLLAIACPDSPGHVPEPENTAVTVSGHTLTPVTAIMYSGEGYFEETVVMVTDHPSACSQMSTLDVCSHEADLYIRGIVDAPSSVATSLVLSALGTKPGTYGIGDACYISSATARAVFAVHDPNGAVVLRDEASGGTIVVEAVQPGVSASGRYDLVLRSGASISGRFAGTYCAAMTAFAIVPPNRICGAGPLTTTAYGESCSCRGATVLSSCTRATTSDLWTCACTDAHGATSTCALAADAQQPACFATQFTCCPMHF